MKPANDEVQLSVTNWRHRGRKRTIEDGRDVLEAQRSGLGDEATGEWKLDGRLREKRERSGRRRGSDRGRAERVLESDLRQRDSDGGRVDERRGQGERDATGGVVGREVERVDHDAALESVHAVENDLVVQLSQQERGLTRTKPRTSLEIEIPPTVMPSAVTSSSVP